MDPITRIEMEIINGLSANEFQRLCAAYLYADRKRTENEFVNIVDFGSQEGRNQTTKGTPDIYFENQKGEFIYVECTLQRENVFSKLRKDIEKCLNQADTHSIKEIILFYTSSKLSSDQYYQLKLICDAKKVKLTLIGIDKLAHDLYDHYRFIVNEFFHMKLDEDISKDKYTNELLEYTKSLMNHRIKALISNNCRGRPFTIDIVFCIDTTGSMGPILETIRRNCYRIYMDLTDACYKKGKNIEKLRVKVISFKDYLFDKEPITVSNFLSMPENTSELISICNSLKSEGGGDKPESCLEALGFAIQSDWSKEVNIPKRQIIVVWTDAPAHLLEEAHAVGKSPTWMAKNIEELESWWNDEKIIDQNAKRLLLFAPSSVINTFQMHEWTQTLLYDVQDGCGMSEYEWSMIINSITNSI